MILELTLVAGAGFSIGVGLGLMIQIPQRWSKEYWRGRQEGWFACEKMAKERIKEFYPMKYTEMWENLLQ